jgi:MFS transporter, DHA1 family, tetracycline resistance protein
MPDPHPSTAGTATPRGALLVIFLTVFIDLLGFGIVLPVMPRQAGTYLQALGLPPAAEGATIGVLFSVFSLMQFLFSPWWGRISDTIGRRPVLLVSLAGSVVFYALYGFAVTLPPDRAAVAIGLMLLSRIGAGIAGASVGTAAAVIADCTPPERRANGMALIGIAFGAGFTLGPLIAYFGLRLFAEKPWGVGALASLLSLVALVFALTVFKETRRSGNRAGRERPSAARTLAVLGMPAVGPLVLVYFLSIFAFANFEATLARFTEEAFGLTDNGNFLVFASIGAVLMLAGGVYRPLSKRLPESRLLVAGLALLIAGMAGLGFVALAVYRSEVAAAAVPAAVRWLFHLAAATAVVGFAFVNPSVSSLISRHADPERQGEVLGVNQSFASLGRILGPFAGSVLFSLSDSRTLPYAVAVAVLCIVATLMPRITRAAERQ